MCACTERVNTIVTGPRLLPGRRNAQIRALASGGEASANSTGKSFGNGEEARRICKRQPQKAKNATVRDT